MSKQWRAAANGRMRCSLCAELSLDVLGVQRCDCCLLLLFHSVSSRQRKEAHLAPAVSHGCLSPSY